MTHRNCSPQHPVVPRHLPIGVDEFTNLRAAPENLYVDKTEYIAGLLREMGNAPFLFLARPRRFGKTLLISTLEALFQGGQDVFADTWIGQEGRWDWECLRSPVLRLDMDIRAVHDLTTLHAELTTRVTRLARGHNLGVEPLSPGSMLSYLIQDMAMHYGQPVVVLVDEYDTILTENLDRPEVLPDMLDVMRAFYGALKTNARHIRFAFVTGITRFARVGLFSGANQFEDISFRADCNSLLGFTEDELHTNPDLAADIAQSATYLGCTTDDLYAALKDHYDGYQFSRRRETVYNPFSLAHCLGELRREPSPADIPLALDKLPHTWAASGTPSLLFRLLEVKRNRLTSDLEGDPPDPLWVLQKVNFDMVKPDMNVLLCQAGYLTLKPHEAAPDRLRLAFPNHEVRTAFRESLLEWQEDLVTATMTHQSALVAALNTALHDSDTVGIQRCLTALLQEIPFYMHTLAPPVRAVHDYELYYQTCLYCLFKGMHLEVSAEMASALGRLDIVADLADQIVLFELKTEGLAREAVQQALNRNYPAVVQDRGLPVVLYGLRFHRSRRAVTDIYRKDLGQFNAARGEWDGLRDTS